MEVFLINTIEEIAFSEVEVDEALWSSKILDSITVIELAVEIENKFNIKIPIEEIIEDNFQTVSNMMIYIDSKLGAKNA